MAKYRKMRIGFVSTRFGATDGVSLESTKWAVALTKLGHECFYFSGLSDLPIERSYLVPEAYFQHPEILRIYEISFNYRVRPPEITDKIHQIKNLLKGHLHAYVKKFGIDLLLVENALAIPLNVPLGLALTEYIAETGIATIAHHHDFSWERERFLVNCIGDYISTAFPPNLPTIQHVVINSSASRQFSLRTGFVAALIPNVMDFDTPPPSPGEYTNSLREDLGINEGEYFILQPTRIVKRKAIERSVELIRFLGIGARLIISSPNTDEGEDYEAYIRWLAQILDVKINIVNEIIQDQRGNLADGRKIYSLWDVYPHADLVTFPSQLEGFGNAFLEAVYFKRPIVVNTYTIYDIDIKPKGFEAIEFDGFITPKTVERVRKVLTTPALVEEMTQHNYELGKRFYSFQTLEYHLRALIHAAFGSE